MIGRLVGTIVAEEPSGLLLVDVGGVGYEVMAPVGTAGRLRGDAGDARVVLLVHTHVREDSLDLFGFATDVERRIFRLLLSVPNVGPKTALAVVSSLPPPELARAVESNDLASLSRVSGVGKKTAERLVLELREKLPLISDLGAGPRPDVPSGHADEGRLLRALTNMGYRPGEAERAVKALGNRVGREPLADLLKAALGELGA